MISCTVLADSCNPVGDRLVTCEVTFPRPFLAEINTHRMLSRNSASSRAIPTEKQIERVRNDPYVPVFGARVKGMGVGDSLSPREQRRKQWKWIEGAHAAADLAEQFLDVDKSRANRLLEPFLWHTAILSGTDWANFFALRDNPGAQPEVQELARAMRKAFLDSTYRQLEWGEWHLPLVYPEDRVTDLAAAATSAGRCARVSYDRQHDSESATAASRRWSKLAEAGHWSPGEHPARSVTYSEWDAQVNSREALFNAYRGALVEDCLADKWSMQAMYVGNYKGFVQLRKLYNREAVFER